MSSEQIFVGGEFYYDDRWITRDPAFSSQGLLFLNGGKACLFLISDYLRDHGISRVLLPSYLCPTIVTTLERGGLQTAFYRVNEDLTIDLEDLARRIEDFKAVLFINYFGFLHSTSVREFMLSLRRSGVVVIEDNAQAGFHDHPSGDFVFNSLRKFAPYDGGYLITTHDMTLYLQKYRGVPNRRLALIRQYRSRLADYLFAGIGEHSGLEALFSRAERYYDSDQVVQGDPGEQQAIERLDWQAIKAARRANYRYLMDLVSTMPGIEPIFPTLQEDNMPLGLPVYFRQVSRDLVNQELGNAQIGLTIHWEEILSHPRTRTDRLSVDMASRMLTLAIDQRASRKQMDYLASQLARGIKTVKR